MDKLEVIDRIYQIAMLECPSVEIVQLLEAESIDRILDLMLIMRQQRQIKSPLNFLRRAIQENWSAETTPRKVDRHFQNVAENYYIVRGHTRDEARKLANDNININTNVKMEGWK